MNPLATIGQSIIIELFLTIDTILLNLAIWIYTFFLEIANARIFNNDFYENLSNRFYVIIGVVALFIVAYSLLQIIINPDSKSENGVDVLKRVVIAIVMVAIVPAMFDFLYAFQSSVLSGNVINALFLGNSALENGEKGYTYKAYEVDGVKYFKCDDCDKANILECSESQRIVADSYIDEEGKVSEDVFHKDENNKFCNADHSLEKDITTFNSNFESQKLIANEFGIQILSSFLYVSPDYNQDVVIDAGDYFPFSDVINGPLVTCISSPTMGAVGITASIISAGILSSGVAIATAVVFAECTGLYGLIGLSSNEYQWSAVYSNLYLTADYSTIIPFSEAIVDGRMTYNWGISGMCLIFIVYVLVVFILDLGLRVVKMAFYQIIAPIPIFMSILPTSDKLLMNWLKLVMTTYAEVFIRVALLAGTTLFLSNLNYEFLDSIGAIGKLVIIMGIIAFVQKAPKLLGEVTGIKSEGMSLSIGKRLSENGGSALGAGVLGAATGLARNSAPAFQEAYGAAKWDKTSTNKWAKAGNNAKAFGGATLSAIKKNNVKPIVPGALSGVRAMTTGGGYKAKNLKELKGSVETGYKQMNDASIKLRENMSRYESEYNSDGDLKTLQTFMKGSVEDGIYNMKSALHLEGNFAEIEAKSKVNKSVTEPFNAMRENMKVIMNNVNNKDTMHREYNSNAKGQKSGYSIGVQREMLERYKKLTDEDLEKALNSQDQGFIFETFDGLGSTIPIKTSAELIKFTNDFEDKLRDLEKDTTEYWANKFLDEDYLSQISTSTSTTDQEIYNTITAGPARKNLVELVENGKIAEASLKKNLGELNDDVTSIGKHAFTVSELNSSSYKEKRFTASADYSKSAEINEASNLFIRRNAEARQQEIKKDN